MTLQVEQSTGAGRAKIFKAIGLVFDSLEPRFKAGDLEKLCKFSKSPYHRMAVASVLEQDFRCRKVGLRSSDAFWVKP